jgi:hypothetical protein
MSNTRESELTLFVSLSFAKEREKGQSGLTKLIGYSSNNQETGT